MVTTTEQVWEAFHAPLHQFIRRRVSDESLAEDLLQEVFLKIHQYGESLKEVKHLEGWMYQITRNLIIDSYRSHRTTMTSLDAREALDLPEELPDDDIVSELLPCVRAMVLALSDQDRQAIDLNLVSGTDPERTGRTPWSLIFRGEIARPTGQRKTQAAASGLLPF